MHKCDDQVGCCTGEKHCVAMEQKVIFKYFYNLSSDKRQSKVVRLEFVNDTRCQCREKDNHINHSLNELNNNQLNNNQLNDRSSYLTRLNGNENANVIKLTDDLVKTNQYDNQYDNNRLESPNDNQIDDQSNVKTIDKAHSYWNKRFNGKLIIKNLFDCKMIKHCPEPFSIVQQKDDLNQCYCGCKSKSNYNNFNNCIKIMNGLKRLDNLQISCILTGKCLEPECLFKTEQWNFNKYTGWCPNQKDVLGIY